MSPSLISIATGPFCQSEFVSLSRQEGKIIFIPTVDYIKTISRPNPENKMTCNGLAIDLLLNLA